MDELRARAYLDLLLGKDSRPRARGHGAGPAARRARAAGPGRAAAGGAAARVRRAGHADRVPLAHR